MKKITIITIVAVLAAAAAVACTTGKPNSKKAKSAVIETTELCSAKGYRGTTPVKVTIDNGVVVSIEALPNKETPRFFQRVVDNLLPKYKGVKVKKAAEMTAEQIPDGCTGATYSTCAVQQNIKAALDKYCSE